MNLLGASRPHSPRLPVAIAALCAAFLLFGAAGASAAIRYAAPGGTEPASSPCEQAHPCSLFNAADRFVPNTHLQEGDEVVIEPGTYSGVAGDLGPEGAIILPSNTSIHGVAGQPRPIIKVDIGNAGIEAFLMNEPGDVLSRVETVSTGQRRGFALDSSGVVDGVVARTSGNIAPCSARDGVIRNSACLSTGDFGSAVSIDSSTAKLRNVTAIATGIGSHGLKVTAAVGELNVEAIGLLARGAAGDVMARAFSLPPSNPNTGAKVTINLDHSDFADIETENDAGGGAATITAPGFGSNITAEPLLAADGYHELLGSPTIGHGATDAFSGTTDIDGEQRVLGLADIGADELQIATTTFLSCSPGNLVAAAGPTTCTATVTTATGTPEGTVKLASDGPGAFAAAGSCSLIATANGQASCHLAYTPSAAGSGTHKLNASYQGDAVHSASEGSSTVRVAAAPVKAPNTTLKRKPARKTAARQATFIFGSDQAGSRFECKLDKRAFKPCRSPFKAKRLKSGRHSFQVRAVNGAGVPDPTPVRFRWKVS
jgi:hypothetical protein